MNDIKIIKLCGKHGGFTIVDNEWFEELNRFKWLKTDEGYVVRWIGKFDKRICIRMHRVILNVSNNREADHKNGYGHDNTTRNLRLSTHAQNAYNQRKQIGPCTSKFKGMNWDTVMDLWRARIRKGNTFYHLGFFKDEVQAAIAYNRAARELFGEFACLNLVDESLYNPQARIKTQKAVYPGAYTKGSLWRAVAWENGKSKYLGTFKDPKLASQTVKEFYERNKITPRRKFIDC